MSRPIAYAEELAEGIAQALSGAVWTPRSLHHRGTDMLAAGLAAGLRAVPLPDLPSAGGDAPTSIDGGGLVDAVAELLGSADAALDAGRRIGALVTDLLGGYATIAAASSAAGGGASGGGWQAIVSSMVPGPAGVDPDADGPFTLDEAIDTVRQQVERMGVIYGSAIQDVIADLPTWASRLVVANTVAVGALGLIERGVLLPSSIPIGIYVHGWLEEAYRWYYGGPMTRGSLPGPVRRPFSEIVQERRVYYPDRPSRALSEVTPLSVTWQTRVPLRPTQPRAPRVTRYDALWVGLWSPRSMGNLRPDTLDFTRRMIWEIKPANRAEEAVAQIFQYVTGYNLAYDSLTPMRPVMIPDRDEARAIAPGLEFAWPSLAPIPVLIRNPPALAFPFTMMPLSGVVAYAVVPFEAVLEEVQRLYRELNAAARRALARLRQALGELGDAISEAGERGRQWGKEIADDIGRLRPAPGGLPRPERPPLGPMPLPAPALVAQILALLMMVALLIVATRGAALVVVVAIIAALILSLQRGRQEGGAGQQASSPGAPAGLPAGAPGAGTEPAPVVTLSTPLGPLDLPAGSVQPLIAAAGLAGERFVAAMGPAMAEAAVQAYDELGPLGPPRRPAGPVSAAPLA